MQRGTLFKLGKELIDLASLVKEWVQLQAETGLGTRSVRATWEQNKNNNLMKRETFIKTSLDRMN